MSDGIPTCQVLFINRSALYAVLVRRNLRCPKSMSLAESSNPTEQPPKTSPVRLLFRLVLVGAILIASYQMLSPYWTRVSTWNLSDNDDAMRVLQVRDWLAGQAWFDVSQHRFTEHPISNIHWSRIADLPLALTTLITSLMFGQSMGEKAAAFLTPMWLGLVYVIIAAKASVALGGKKAFLPAIFLISCAPAVLPYFLPGRVDHHGLQLLFLSAALWGLIAGGARMAVLSGIAIALGIGVGLEALPLQIVLIGWVALRWALRGATVQDETRWFAASLGLGLAICFVATVPEAKWAAPVNDAIGRGHAVLGLIGGLLLAVATLFPTGRLGSKDGIVVRLVLLIMIGGIVLAGVRYFPEVIVPPYDQIDPLLKRLWLNNVTEAAPMMKAKLSAILGVTLFPVLAGIASIIALLWAKDKERDLWILAALTIFVSVALAVFWQGRAAGLATTVSGIMAAALIGKLMEQVNFKTALIAAVIVNPIIPGFVGAKVAEYFEPKIRKFSTGGGAGCFTERAFSSLKAQSPGLVVAPIDMGSRILLTTQHRVLAVPYHRNNKGNLASYRLFMAQPDVAKTMAKDLGASYLAICTKSAEVAILSREAPKGLMAELRDGRVPAWLIPIEKPKGSNVQAFKVNLD